MVSECRFNGEIIHQDKRVQNKLEENSSVKGESQIFMNKKFILLEQKYGDDNDKDRHIVLEFDRHGYATEIGSFDQFKKQMYKLMRDLDTWQAQDNVQDAI